jgi:hypothetical protein
MPGIVEAVCGGEVRSLSCRGAKNTKGGVWGSSNIKKGRLCRNGG